MSKNKTILVIDDEMDERTYLTTIFEDNGYNVISANDGNEGISKVKSSPPDLITLDVTMPEKSGVKFYREMRESNEYKSIPIIIITGVSKDFKQFISTRKNIPPPEGYIPKPVDQKKLFELVEKLIP